MKVETLPNALFTSNTYLVVENKEAVIVDPGLEGSTLNAYFSRHGLNPIAIILTHGHFDHFHGAGDIQKKYGIPVYVHDMDIVMLENNRLNGTEQFKVPVSYQLDATPLYDGQILFPATFKIEVIHTPFHTKGSSCYLLKKEGYLFTGDTLFKNSIGRSDLPTGSFRTVIPSLEKLQLLDEKIVVYPGHGPKTTIGDELRFNRYFKKRIS